MFPLSKRAIQVVIEPLDPAIQQAVVRINQHDPGVLARVHKIVVHPGGGSELGHVQSGEGHDPQEIHLYKGQIEQLVRRQLAASGGKPTPAAYADALEKAIVEVIGHESGHIGPERPIAPGATPFLGEPQAESKAKEIVKRVFPGVLAHASLELDAIREKFLPDHPPGEPDLAFVGNTVAGRREASLRSGLRILRRGGIPAALAAGDARRHNDMAVRQRDVARGLGFLVGMLGELPCADGFAAALAAWQERNGLDPTGMIDRPTMAHMRARMGGGTGAFPRNFGVVCGNLCRGGQPDDPGQLRALRDERGVRRIVTLNDDKPEIAGWCRALGLEHVHAPLAAGKPEEPGWSVFGPSLSGFILEKPTFVHCRHGADRTGGVVARCRTETGWPCDLAYAEAKAFGFKDRFPDMVDRFAESCRHDPAAHRHPPIDTAAMRRILEELEAHRPVEQDILEPTPSDLHYTPGDSHGYDTGPSTDLWSYNIRSIPSSQVAGR
jgi:hypothetical protein